MDKTLIGFLVGSLTTGAFAIILTLVKARAFQKVTDAYERIIEKQNGQVDTANRQVTEVLDRFYGAKNLAPGNIDMAQAWTERREEEKEKRTERKNGGALPNRIGRVDDIQAQMEQGVRDGRYARPKAVANP